MLKNLLAMPIFAFPKILGRGAPLPRTLGQTHKGEGYVFAKKCQGVWRGLHKFLCFITVLLARFLTSKRGWGILKSLLTFAPPHSLYFSGKKGLGIT